MKRLRFNFYAYFRNLRTIGNSRATLGRRWNGSLQHVTEERLEKVFTTQRKTFHPCRKLFPLPETSIPRRPVLRPRSTRLLTIAEKALAKLWTCPDFVDPWVKLPMLRDPADARRPGG
jgi:hypothetical protein